MSSPGPGIPPKQGVWRRQHPERDTRPGGLWFMVVAMEPTPIPETTVQVIAPETYLIPNLAPGEPGLVPVNSMVIRGAEPVIVDTGAPMHRAQWLERCSPSSSPRTSAGSSSPTTTATTGGLLDVLERCPSHARRLLQRRAPGPRQRRAPLRADALDRPGRQLRRRRPHAAPLQAAGLRRPHDPWPVRSDRCHVGGRLVHLHDLARSTSTTCRATSSPRTCRP